ncbi:uncharacterized protein N7515_000738 [Penicillium bovifimosum]|uniref:Uncharacterized protein n=1 Tax=Penicillium bovifimosum TaxID=126998 RepID=A0A9W9HFK3_9EURO|nr:uncharacterized protein N7515_000738 [Penicillium bovifimosum]KAJ5146174.1 hypothetical protein N7515_000738 [Penicillium bovifimosum]
MQQRHDDPYAAAEAQATQGQSIETSSTLKHNSQLDEGSLERKTEKGCGAEEKKTPQGKI